MGVKVTQFSLEITNNYFFNHNPGLARLIFLPSVQACGEGVKEMSDVKYNEC